MVTLDKAVVARLQRFGQDYEVLVDPDGAEVALEKVQRGEEVPDDAWLRLLAVDDVFTDAGQGERASAEQRQSAFGTMEVAAIARRILTEGHLQLTAEMRRRMADQKHRRVLEHILRHAWNPQTKAPHPRERIERALEEAKFRVDPMRHVEEQAQEALKKLRPLLPIAFERIDVAVLVPAEHTGTAFGVLRQLGELRNQEWQEDGSLISVLRIPAGAQTEVYDRLNQVTQGSVQTRIIGSKENIK